MSGPAKILVLVATVAVLAVAFFVFAPGDDEADTTATTATTATTTTVAPQTTATQPVVSAPPAPKPPAPSYETVRVRAGKPVGGVRRIKLRKSDRARIEVRSADTSDEVHVHGYDLSKDLKAGGRVRFAFEANAEGIYEVELEGAGVAIAELVVEPR